MVHQMDSEHSGLASYFQDLSQNLKTVHAKLITEAEQNKNMSNQKDHLLESLKKMKKTIIRKSYNYSKYLQRMERQLMNTMQKTNNFQSI